MNEIGALGAAVDVEPFALAGASIFSAATAADIDAMWDALPADLAVLVLTAAAAEHLGERVQERPHILTVVIPR